MITGAEFRSHKTVQLAPSFLSAMSVVAEAQRARSRATSQAFATVATTRSSLLSQRLSGLAEAHRAGVAQALAPLTTQVAGLDRAGSVLSVVAEAQRAASARSIAFERTVPDIARPSIFRSEDERQEPCPRSERELSEAATRVVLDLLDHRSSPDATVFIAYAVGLPVWAVATALTVAFAYMQGGWIPGLELALGWMAVLQSFPKT